MKQTNVRPGEVRAAYLARLLLVTIIATLTVATVTATAEEQPLAIIEVCYDDDCWWADSGDCIEILACEKVTLTSAWQPPENTEVTETWDINGHLQSGHNIEYIPRKRGYTKIGLMVSNGEQSHETHVSIRASENKAPKLLEVIAVSGDTYSEEEVFQPEQSLYIETALNRVVEVTRSYDNEDDDMLTQEIENVSNSKVVTVGEDCDTDECWTELRFPEIGEHHLRFTDTDICGNSVTTDVYVDVFRNKLPEAIIRGDCMGTEDSSQDLSGEESETGDDPGDWICIYNWTVFKFNSTTVVETYYSDDPDFSFDGEGGLCYDVWLEVTDNYGSVDFTDDPYTVCFEKTTNDPPHADYSGTPLVVEVGEKFTVVAINSTDNHGISRYEWRFYHNYKGHRELEQSISTSSPTYTTRVNRTGTYDVELKVIDDGYLSDDGFPEESEPAEFQMKSVNPPEATNTTVAPESDEAAPEATVENARETPKTPNAVKRAISGVFWFIKSTIKIVFIALVVLVPVILLIRRRNINKRKKANETQD